MVDTMAKNMLEISMTWDMISRIKVMEASKTMTSTINIIKVMTRVIMDIKEEDINNMISIIREEIMHIQTSMADRLEDNLAISTMDMRASNLENKNKSNQVQSMVKRIRIRIKILLFLIKARDRGKTISMKMKRVNQWLRERLENRILQQKTINHAISPKARVVDRPSNGPTSQRARNRLSNSNHKCNMLQRMTEEELLIKPIVTIKAVVAMVEVDVEQTDPLERQLMAKMKVTAIMRRRVSTMRKRRDTPRTKGEANEIGMRSRLATKEDVTLQEMREERTEEKLLKITMIATNMMIGLTMDTKMNMLTMTAIATTMIFTTMVKRTIMEMAMVGLGMKTMTALTIIATWRNWMLSEIVEKSHGHHRKEEKTEVVGERKSNAIRRTTSEVEARERRDPNQANLENSKHEEGLDPMITARTSVHNTRRSRQPRKKTLKQIKPQLRRTGTPKKCKSTMAMMQDRLNAMMTSRMTSSGGTTRNMKRMTQRIILKTNPTEAAQHQAQAGPATTRYHGRTTPWVHRQIASRVLAPL